MTAKLAKRQLELTLVRSDPTHPTVTYVNPFMRSGGRQAYSAFTFLPVLPFFAVCLSLVGLFLLSALVTFLAVSSAELACASVTIQEGGGQGIHQPRARDHYATGPFTLPSSLLTSRAFTTCR